MNRRYTLIVLLIFVALAILAYLQRDAEPIDFTDGGPTPTAAPILEVEGADVQEVEVTDGFQSYTLVRVAGGWEIDEEPLNDLVDATIGRIANPTVLRTLPEDVEADAFGFDSPTLTVTLATAGGESHTMVLGAKHPVDPQYYLRLDGDARIVIVSSSDFDSLVNWFETPPFAPTPTPEVDEEATAEAEAALDEAEEGDEEGSGDADEDEAMTDEDEGVSTPDPADDADADAEEGMEDEEAAPSETPEPDEG
jgi:hypothetical protein